MKKIMILSCLMLLAMPAAIKAEVVKADKAIVVEKDKLAGGVGITHCKFAFTRDQPPATAAIREMGFLTLHPGDSIGYHKHTENEDSYIIVSGTGLYKDADGKEYEVGPGDMTYVRAGESHGLTNNGKEPLVFVSVIAAK